MAVTALLQSLYDTPLAAWIRESELAFPCIECVHVAAISLVVGTIAVVDLRLLGLASLERRLSRLFADVLPLTWGAFAVAAASGLLLFASNAPRYAGNAYFRAKLLLLVLAGINMLVFNLGARRGLAGWDDGPAPRAARLAGALSLAVWFAVIAAGRWIGFTMLAGY